MARTSGVSSGGSGGGLLAVAQYAPSSRATYDLTSTLAALDTTNMTVSFTTAASGNGSKHVLVKAYFSLNTTISGDTCYFGFFTHSTTTVVGGLSRFIGPNAANDTIFLPLVIETYITGLTAGTAYQYDLAGYSANGDAVVYAQQLSAVASASAGPAIFEVYGAP